MSFTTPTLFVPELSTSPIDDPIALLTGGLASRRFDSLTSKGLANVSGFQTNADTLYPSWANPYLQQIGDLQGNTTPLDLSKSPAEVVKAITSLTTATAPDIAQIFGPLPAAPAFVTPHNTYQGDDTEVATYSGSDMRVMIEVPDPSGNGQSRRREFLELSTLSVSIYRVKCPARACGYINPRGFARGTRTIAGTMVMTQFTVDILYRFLFSTVHSSDLSKDSHYLKPDQLPPFNLTVYFLDEYGHESYRRLLGVDMANDGTVYSSKDFYSEQTISYMASDFTPLLPIENHAQLLKNPLSTASRQQKGPMSVLRRGKGSS